MAKKKVNNEKILSSSELLKMELGSANSKNRELHLKCSRIELDKAKKELTLLSANYTLKNKEIEEIQMKIIEQERSNLKKLEEHKEFVDEIRERLTLKKQWGYNPNTGEIKE